ncbi:hypothetical protein M758_7G175100 [Ceratodon purpureus]|nr:hypothetical protein M758_7G175100 [Ceratodon purpureus]
MLACLLACCPCGVVWRGQVLNCGFFLSACVTQEWDDDDDDDDGSWIMGGGPDSLPSGEQKPNLS